MSDFVRHTLARLLRITDRRIAPRFKSRLPVIVSVDGAPKGAIAPEVEGYTRDLSRSGVGMVLPTVKLGNDYLSTVGQELLLELEHPTGPILLKVESIRYEQVEVEEKKWFLIGVRIIEIEAKDRDRYYRYLSKLARRWF